MSRKAVPAPNPVVTVCQGHRCRALLSHQDPDAMSAMRELTGGSGRGVLVSTPCAGACAYGPVVGVGAGHQVDGTMRIGLQALLGPVEARHLSDLGSYLDAPAPSRRLPKALEQIRLHT